MRVAMFIDNTFVTDMRVIREAETLHKAGYSLTVYALEDNQLPVNEVRNGITINRIIPRTIFKTLNRKVTKNLINEIALKRYDVVHCHDHFMLQLGVGYKKQAPSTILIYDSHELFYEWPINFTGNESISIRLKSILARRYQVYLEHKDIKMADYVITVNNSISQILHKHFRLKNAPMVLFNVHELELVDKNQNLIRNEYSIPASTKIIVYIGTHLYRSSLCIEKAILEFGNKENIAFVIISAEGFGKTYYEDIVKENNFNNIFFKKFVLPKEITPVLSSCDIGLVATWEKKYLSYWYALDSKVFSYIMAELPVLATSQPEYLKIVGDEGIGICVNPDMKNSFLTGAIDLLSNYEVYLDHVKKAKEKYNWDNEKLKLESLYKEIILNPIK